MKDLIIEVDITQKCNLACRYCNRLCNAESRYGIKRDVTEMSMRHIDYLISQIKKLDKGTIRMIRILGGEPLLSSIIISAVIAFEKLIEKGFIKEINIVTNGTVNIPKECADYIVYAPQSLGKMVSERNRPLTPLEVLTVKNSKHRNITVSPTDLNLQGKICDRVQICGINYSVYGFCFCAPCFPSLMVSKKNHQYFFHSLPSDLKSLTPDGFENNVCSICNFAIEDYKSFVNQKPELQSPNFIGKTWQRIILDNRSKYQEPDTDWIDSVII